jgi:hypothetical protein
MNVGWEQQPSVAVAMISTEEVSTTTAKGGLMTSGSHKDVVEEVGGTCGYGVKCAQSLASSSIGVVFFVVRPHHMKRTRPGRVLGL